jgi:pyruvate dehydrogenase E2 component (dihydrolipoamide acetyltransferase)
MALKEFKVPDLGEGLTEAEIVNWLVAAGDTVELNQPLVEVETEKAIVEVPSPYAGVIKELRGAVGERVAVGSTFVVFETEGAEGEEPASAGSRKEVLVGYGPEEGGSKRRKDRKIGRRKDDATDGEAPHEAEAPSAGSSPEPSAQTAGVTAGAARSTNGSGGSAGVRALATPPVRKLARELGIDIDQVTGSGPGGRVTREDVQAASGDTETAPGAAADDAEAPAAAPAAVKRRGDAASEERIPVRSIRRLIAERMVRSVQTIPHVSEWVQVDASELMRLREQLKPAAAEQGVKLSPLPLCAKALIAALKTYPLINSAWSDEGPEIIVSHHVHLGIAADTDRGLLVPVVRDADAMNVFQIAAEITRLVDLSRSGKIGPGDLSGSTITITNIGSFGMESGTPIINAPEAAILALGAVAKRPWVHNGEVKPRDVMTIALSFDHRIVDGAYAGRFLRHLGDLIETPARLLATL